MHRLRTTSLLCALLAAALPAQAQQTVLRVMAQESIAPKWIMKGRHAEGLCPDILAALEKTEPRLRFTGTSEARSVPLIEKELEAGNLDVACALLDTAHRQEIAQIVGKPLYSVRHRIAAAIGDTAVVNGYDDLVKLNPLINTSRGAGYTDQLRALGLQVDDSTGDNALNLRKILAGHGRFMYMNQLTLNWFIKSGHLQDKIRILPVVFKEEPVYFWVSRKAPPATVRLVDDALGRLSASGELARIYERWAGAK